MLMLVSCSCIVVASRDFNMAQLISFKFNRIIMNLNNCWLSHVPLNRANQCNHICFYGKALMRSIVMPLAGASNEVRLCAGATLAG